MKKLLLFLMLSLCSINISKAQGILVTGTVIDSFDNQPFPLGFPVWVKGTMNGTITNLDGYFSIHVNINSILVFSMIGYQTIEHLVTPIDAYRPLEIIMYEDIFDPDNENITTILDYSNVISLKQKYLLKPFAC